MRCFLEALHPLLHGPLARALVKVFSDARIGPTRTVETNNVVSHIRLVGNALDHQEQAAWRAVQRFL